jgi:flavorubredoxin
MDMGTTVVGPRNVAEGVFWIGAHRGDSWIQCNTYLLLRDDGAIMIDPGPDILFAQNMEALGQLCEPGTVNHIVATHPTPDAISSLSLWQSSGVQAPLLAHWWAATAITLGGYTVQVLNVHPGNRVDRSPGPGVEILLLPGIANTGAICLFDHESGTLFSGDLFGSIGGSSGD